MPEIMSLISTIYDLLHQIGALLSEGGFHHYVAIVYALYSDCLFCWVVGSLCDQHNPLIYKALYRETAHNRLRNKIKPKGCIYSCRKPLVLCRFRDSRGFFGMYNYVFN